MDSDFFPHNIFSTTTLILAQMITSSSLNPQYMSSRSALLKYLYILSFFQFRPIVIILWNEWFVWNHIIWVCNGNTELFCFCYSVLTQPSLIIWLICLFHLLCPNISSFVYYNDLIPPIHAVLCWGIGRNACYQAMDLVTCRNNS